MMNEAQKGAQKENLQALQERVDQAPAQPGVYLMKNARGTVLYVGKARSLRDRIRSYFQKGAALSPRIAAMVRQVADVEWMVTGSELEALILENHLIKRYRPRYNVLLRDDKNYPLIRLSVQDSYPRITVVRRMQKDGARYFGPYVPAHALRETLKVIQRAFPLATCTLDLTRHYDRACVEYEIKRCAGPCIGAVSQEEYRKIAREVEWFLEGRDRELLDSLRRRMEEAASRLAFEEAARIRNRIRHIERILERQRIVVPEVGDADVLAAVREGNAAELQVLFFRSGMLVGRKELFYAQLGEAPLTDLCSAFIQQHYSRDVPVPETLLVPEPLPDQDLLTRWLSERRGGPVRIQVPRRGRKRELLALAQENARELLRTRLGREGAVRQGLEDLTRWLGLPRVPFRIEAFDISNLFGVQAVGSLVVWEGTGMKREEYRHYKIQTVQGADDFAMMREVVYRRYQRVLREGKPLPDLVLIDGGKGQLNAALEALSDLGLSDLPVAALAKERGEKGERVFLPGRPEALPLDPTAPATHILQQIRDEAHRFALRYHQKLRGKEALLSRLDGIRGIGRARKLALLRYFGTVEALMAASVEEIQKVPRMSRKVAEETWRALHEAAPSPEERATRRPA